MTIDGKIQLLHPPMNYSMAVKEVDPGQYLPHNVLDPLRCEAGRRTLLNVEVEVLVHVLEHQEQVHLPPHLHPLAVTNIQQSGSIEIRSMMKLLKLFVAKYANFTPTIVHSFLCLWLYFYYFSFVLL